MKSFLAAILAGSLLCAGNALAASVLFVLDASGSMWGQVDGEHKIEIARRVLGDLINDLPAEIEVGLEAYGHNRKDDCADIEVIAPLGTPRARIIQAVNALNPKGMTPLTESIRVAAQQLRGIESAASVVVVSDGKETCDGDPCAAAAEARASGSNVRIHVVGFDVTPDEAEQLNCIAANGGGKYFSAGSASELAKAFEEVKVVVAQAAPPPPAQPKPAEPSVFFADEFDGTSLAAHWAVANPNLDGYIVENGKLMIVNGSNKDFAHELPENLFQLTTPLPPGNWRATIKYDLPYQTGIEILFLGLYQDPANLIGARHWVWTYSCCTLKFSTGGVKISNAERTEFQNDAFEWRTESGGIEVQGAQMKQPQYLRLTKTGRNYVASAKFGDEAGTQWIEIQKLTLLSPKGQLSFQFGNHAETPGEALIEIDSITIEQVP